MAGVLHLPVIDLASPDRLSTANFIRQVLQVLPRLLKLDRRLTLFYVRMVRLCRIFQAWEVANSYFLLEFANSHCLDWIASLPINPRWR